MTSDGPEKIVAGERLRDQVYRRLRQDLQSGAIAAGERLVEAQLAARLGVSRTPIRESLVQLSREGLVRTDGRGYVAPLDTRKDIVDRLEVRRMLDARMARHAAQDATPEQIQALVKAHDRQRSAHRSGRHKVFIESHQEFRSLARVMCANALLVRCAEMVDGAFQVMRARLHERAANREITLACDADLLEAIRARDPDRAEAAIHAFIDRLSEAFEASDEASPQA